MCSWGLVRFWYKVGTYHLGTAEEKYFRLPLVDGNVDLKRVNGIVKFNKDTQDRVRARSRKNTAGT